MNDEELTRDLVVKYINRSCTEDELRTLFSLLEKNSISLAEWDAATQKAWNDEPVETLDADTCGIYRDKAMRLIGKHKKNAGFHKRAVPPRRIAAIAASLAILITGGYFVTSGIMENRLEKQLATYEHVGTDAGQMREVTLPDGTEVILNVASSLKYNARYGKETREVWLDGEAYFDVKSDAGCPFSIHSGQLDVNVTGTSFNVCSYPDDPRASVTVKSGRVGVVYGSDDIRMTLRQDEEIVINTADSSVSRNTVKVNNALAWMSGALVFRQNTLEEAIRILQRYYPCKIELRDSTSRIRLSGTHDNKSLESVLESICFSAGLQYTENDGCYIIY